MWPFKRPKPRIYTPPPRSPQASTALEALRTVPGPSPWYLDGATLATGGSTLRWQSAGDGPRLAGKSVLLNPAGQPVAVADFHCYVRQLGPHHLLVWFTEEHGGALLRSAIRLRVFEINALRAIADLADAYATLGPASRFYASSGETASVALSTALDDNIHSVEIPQPLREAGELLILAHSTADGRRENHFDEMHLRLWILDAPSGRLEIVPQDWFNNGAYDFEYQWVTRVARVPGTGKLVGEGIRLGVFQLDSSRRNVAEWLVEDIFYHPERAGAGS